MVDHAARRRYAELVRQFISGRMTNDEYEKRFKAIKYDPNDTAISEVYYELWFLYDDIKTHRMTGSDSLSREGRRKTAQVVMFLQSSIEYQWPKDAMLGTSLIFWLVIVYILSLTSMRLFSVQSHFVITASLVTGLSLIAYHGFLRIMENRSSQVRGDKDAWPFLHKAELEEAKRHPRLLNGR